MEKPIRRLNVIMFTDISGYTAMMGRSQKTALEIVEKSRKIQAPLIEKFEGRIFKEMGDGILAVFQDALSAATCAVEMQQEFSNWEDAKIKIGLHLGEVTWLNDDIYGDAVNIAARIQDLTPPGQVTISESVYDQIKNIETISCINLGKVKLKNVFTRINVYGLQIEGLEKYDRSIIEAFKGRRRVKITAISILFLSLSLIGYYYFFNTSNHRTYGKIAVIPFSTLPQDDSSKYFSLGITEDIAIHLSRISSLRVIPPSYFRGYDFENKSIKDMGNDFKVDEVLIGSIRRDKDKIRITASLVSVKTGEEYWSSDYDRDYVEIFAIQSDVARNIASQLEATLTPEEENSLENYQTNSSVAYEFFLKGKEFYAKGDISNLLSAIDLYYEALRLDHNFIEAHAGISDAFSQIAQRTNFENRWLDSSRVHAGIVKEKRPNLSAGHKAMGLYYSVMGDYKRAEEAYLKAIDIDDNIEAVINLSRIYYRTNKIQNAYRILEKVKWKYPTNPDLLFSLADIHYRLSNFYESNQYLDQTLKLKPDHINSLLLKWFLASLTGDQATAQSVAKQLAIVASDESDKIFVILTKGINDPQYFKDHGEEVLQMLQGREADYIDLPNIFNLITFAYAKADLSRSDSLVNLRISYNQNKISEGNLDYKLAYELAEIFAIKGNSDLALKWLKNAYKGGWLEYPYAGITPMFDKFRESDEFIKVLQRAKSKSDSLKRFIQSEDL